MGATKHHAAQYNLVAKKLRDNFPLATEPFFPDEHVQREIDIAVRTKVVLIALDFARSFKKDNLLFDPLKFLDACSPDTDQYPLSELWEEDSG